MGNWIRKHPGAFAVLYFAVASAVALWAGAAIAQMRGLFREDSVRTDGVVFTRVRDQTEHRVCYVLTSEVILQSGVYGDGKFSTFQCYPERSP